jgi:hypothetical protein
LSPASPPCASNGNLASLSPIGPTCGTENSAPRLCQKLPAIQEEPCFWAQPDRARVHTAQLCSPAVKRALPPARTWAAEHAPLHVSSKSAHNEIHAPPHDFCAPKLMNKHAGAVPRVNQGCGRSWPSRWFRPQPSLCRPSMPPTGAASMLAAHPQHPTFRIIDMKWSAQHATRSGSQQPQDTGYAYSRRPGRPPEPCSHMGRSISSLTVVVPLPPSH